MDVKNKKVARTSLIKIRRWLNTYAIKDPNKMEVLISSGCSSDNLAVSEFKIIRRLLTSNGKVEKKFEDLKELKDKDGKNEEPIEVKSPLLEEFWKAFNFVKNKLEKKNYQIIYKKMLNIKLLIDRVLIKSPEGIKTSSGLIVSKNDTSGFKQRCCCQGPG